MARWGVWGALGLVAMYASACGDALPESAGADPGLLANTATTGAGSGSSTGVSSTGVGTGSGTGVGTGVGTGSGTGVGTGAGTGTGAGAGGGAGTGTGPGAGTGTGTGTGSGGGSTGNGLPCNVSAVLSACTACHSNPPVAGAPMPLLTYADLTAPARSNPAKSVAAMVVARVQSTTAPMPPAPSSPLSAGDIATLQAWVNAGTPMGTCGGTSTGTGAGGAAGTGAGGAGAGTGTGGANPFDAPPQCTSNQFWAGGEGGPTMNPGQACITCHATTGGEAPTFHIAGTVYPTAHEPDNCVSMTSMGPAITTAVVEITDKNGQVFDLTVNASGNFYSSGAIATPFSAKVKYAGRERMMGAMQTSGDCNTCHTQSGANGAPGRILLP